MIEEFSEAAVERKLVMTGNTLTDVVGGFRKLILTSVEYLAPSPGRGEPSKPFSAVFSMSPGWIVRPSGIARPWPTKTGARRTSPSASTKRRTVWHIKGCAFGVYPSAHLWVHAGARRKDTGHAGEISASALSDPDSPERDKLLIRPIVVAGEVGAIHGKRRLGFLPSQLTQLDERSPEFVVQEFFKQIREGGPTTPVICLDDFWALQVFRELKTEGCLAVFSMNTKQNIQSDVDRRELYRNTISQSPLKRSDRDLNEFLQDALRQFLSTEVETTALAWLNLAKNLAADLLNILRQATNWNDAERQAIVWSWVRYTLHLDRDSIESFSDPTLPWKPILGRARQMLQVYFAGQDHVLDQVKRFLPGETGDVLTAADMRELCILFDIDIPQAYRRVGRYKGRPAHLASVLRAVLRGRGARKFVR